MKKQTEKMLIYMSVAVGVFLITKVLFRIFWSFDLVDAKLLYLIELSGSAILFLGLEFLFIYFIWSYMKNRLVIKLVVGAEVYVSFISLLFAIYQSLLITTSFDSIVVSTLLKILIVLGVLAWIASIILMFFRKDEKRIITYLLLINLLIAAFISNNLLTRLLFNNFYNGPTSALEMTVRTVISFMGVIAAIIFDGLIIYFANETDKEKLSCNDMKEF